MAKRNQERPKSAQWEPREPQETPKDGQAEPKRGPEAPKRRQERTKSVSGSHCRDQVSASDGTEAPKDPGDLKVRFQEVAMLKI